ncbi:DUF308 domain-containing protein [Streptococcus massiliensis]|uniref:Uncharacterized conserved protein n=1 Tax=Streptococcus massiliensis TaxID=313439 RepID=A0A380KZZ7_9STRE|nr:DUF308 domain-containing protein [Streptococcus massiliensis]SUN76516.1 Uncharacterized conserved protein [Streptococcus massiliensis]
MKTFGKWLSVLAGVLYVCFAIYLFLHPLTNLAAMSWLFAFFIFLGAVSSFVNYFAAPETERRGHLFYAVVNLILATLFLAYGYITLPILLPTLLAVSLILASIGGLIRASRIKKLLPRLGSSLLWTSVVGLVLGILLLFHPMIASLFVSYLVALGFIYGGITYLINALARLDD